jgi:hypothetical protein
LFLRLWEATMGGDYSRFPFDPRRNYSSVLFQQGRVLLDGDWNEQSAIASRVFRATVVDMLGRVFPATPRAFKIESDSRNGLTIARGRIYVDGLVAENHGAGRSAWDAVLDEQHGVEPIPYTKQPFLMEVPELPRSGGPYLVYLDVWLREVTIVDDPDLADPALEGADTTTRLQTVWQVKLHKYSSSSRNRPLEDDRKFRPAASRLSTVGDGYTGVENHLYRVEVHDGGSAGTATFKWSNDNASTVARVTRLIDLSHIIVQPVGFRRAQPFGAGDLIEITDDAGELTQQPGELRRIKTVNGTPSVFALDTPLSPGLFPADQDGIPDATRHMSVRRWKGTGPIQDPNIRIDLEDGIAVTFDTEPADGCFATGDYWLIPARVAARSIERLDRAPPRGIHHHFAKLALFTPPRRLRDLRVTPPRPPRAKTQNPKK